MADFTLPIYPALLSRAEFAMLRFTLELGSDCRLGYPELLAIRPALRRCARMVLGELAAALFDPHPPADPLTARRVQKPAPPFVFRFNTLGERSYAAGERLSLDLLLIGDGLPWLEDLLEIVRLFASSGLNDGRTPCRFQAVEGLSSDGSWQPLWASGQPWPAASPPLVGCDHWLDLCHSSTLPLLLDVVTPTRLVSDGRVLRRPRFTQLFPFFLRRATSVLQSHCDLELSDDLSDYFRAANAVEGRWLSWRWQDWRLAGGQQFGGFTGRLALEGEGLGELTWILLLGGFLGIGKGAACGSGFCRMVTEPTQTFKIC